MAENAEISDLLVNQSAAPQMPDPESLNGLIPENELDRMLERYVWCQKLERYVDRTSCEMLTAKAFNAANVKVAPFGKSGENTAEARFLNHPKARKAIIPTYRPGQDVLIDDVNEHGRTVGAVNLWRPSSLVLPQRLIGDAEIKPWLDHVELIFGYYGDPAATHFLHFVAYLLQEPGKKINHALVIVGETQGTGKDTVFVPIVRALGLHNVQTITPELLASQWTHYLLAQLIRVEEMSNFKRKEMANKLKPLLCSPPETVSINSKNVKQYDIPNIQNWVMFTNHKDALSIEDTDRRYWIHECRLKTPRPTAYYAKLYDWYDAGGCEKVARWLTQLDLRAFNPMAAPPATQAKRAMAVNSQSKQVQWAFEELTAGEFADRSIVLCHELVKAAEAPFDDDNVAPAGVSDKHVAAALTAAGFKQVGQRIKINGKARQLWARDPDGSLSGLSADQLRDRYSAEVPAAPLRRAA